VEAEDFDKGGEGLSYHELDSKNIAGAYRPDEAVDIYALNYDQYHVGNALPGEWYEYSLDVKDAGDYLVEVHCASLTPGGRYLISIGAQSSDTMEVAASGSWLETCKTSFQLSLPSGEQIMRFTVIDHPQYNIDKMVFTLDATWLEKDIPSASGLILYQESGGDLLIRTSGASLLKQVQVFDLRGKLLAVRKDPSSLQRIPGHQLPAGIYLVRAFEEKKIYTEKILVQ
jgi:hypothetical protein